MFNLKSSLTLLLVTCLHLQLGNSAPFDTVREPLEPHLHLHHNGNADSAPFDTVKEPLEPHLHLNHNDNVENAAGGNLAHVTPKPGNASTNAVTHFAGTANTTAGPAGTVSSSVGSASGATNVTSSTVTTRAANPVTVAAGSAAPKSNPAAGVTPRADNLVPTASHATLAGAPGITHPIVSAVTGGIAGNPPCVCVNAVQGLKGPSVKDD
ncbi:Hypothetical predicted protein [Pelobates cultripes]|uniref:Uncharacterized protein n=1 Tax=Pelobates cultripes TaxID=61616 RepID=A0AAD1SY20_PELCU|nr:Hypothetical predicted protein [Pelobates cultripes]